MTDVAFPDVTVKSAASLKKNGCIRRLFSLWDLASFFFQMQKLLIFMGKGKVLKKIYIFLKNSTV